MWLKEENGKLIPPPVNYQTSDGMIMNFYKNPESNFVSFSKCKK